MIGRNSGRGRGIRKEGIWWWRSSNTTSNDPNSFIQNNLVQRLESETKRFYLNPLNLALTFGPHFFEHFTLHIYYYL